VIVKPQAEEGRLRGQREKKKDKQRGNGCKEVSVSLLVVGFKCKQQKIVHFR